MQKSTKTAADDEISAEQQVDTKLQTKPEKVDQLLENQSIEPEILLIESVAGAEIINSKLPREWRVPRNLSLDNVIGQVMKGVQLEDH